MELILENVRCFVGKHTIPVKPLTVLIGENSSGKTTFLAALSVVCNTRELLETPNFNEPPYSLGVFDTIVSFQDGKQSRPKYFSLGRINAKGKKIAAEMIATFKNNQGQAQLCDLSAEGSGNSLTVWLDETGNKYKYKYRLGDQRGEDDYPIKREPFDSPYLVALSVFILNLLPVIKTLSIAPVRTKPKRTYDEFIERFNPEGDDIPYILARILNGKPKSKQEKPFVAALKRFGKESGLFTNVEIRRLGDNPGEPFQIMVDMAGKLVNMLDVGYGISQALPVVVQSVLAAEERLLLLQQPEVHLHPKAQAALGSFFVDMVAESGKQFVIETHSDYIIDRIRQEVAAKKIKPDDVAFLFFEKQGIETTIHHLELDEMGNIINAPPSYREFFLTERLNLLTRGNR